MTYILLSTDQWISNSLSTTSDGAQARYKMRCDRVDSLCPHDRGACRSRCIPPHHGLPIPARLLAYSRKRAVVTCPEKMNNSQGRGI